MKRNIFIFKVFFLTFQILMGLIFLSHDGLSATWLLLYGETKGAITKRNDD